MADEWDTLADIKGAALRCFYFVQVFRGRRTVVDGVCF